VLVVPARLQPAASTAVTATAARALMAVLTGFLLGDVPRQTSLDESNRSLPLRQWS
jgi:hypothetical protein